MLTKAENDFLTRVGPGEPAGELLRRYWHPVAPVQELSDEHPTRFVRLLGEDLVLFKDRSGGVGLLGDHCSHRSASLLYGRVEERGISCAYHGWLYDTRGNCLETPAEPADSKFYLTVKHKAYPVRKFVGLYWAYLGPQPAPEIPRYDLWVRRDGRRRIIVHPRLDCNWLQPMENSADPAHADILHQHPERGHGAANPTRGFVDDIEAYDFRETWYGLMKKRVHQEVGGEEHPILFPNILRVGNTAQIRVPMDDTHCYVVFVRFHPTEDGSLVEEEEDELPVEYREPYKNPPGALYPHTLFRFWDPTQIDNQIQDYMAWETQGPITNRAVEHLATSDRGVVMLRDMLRREIEKVLRGEDPMVVIRDPNHAMIDTNLDESLRHSGRRRAAGMPA